MTDSELRTRQLEEKILDVTASEDVETVLSALAVVITLQMTLVCSDRRKEIAEKLTRSIPVWLAQAETFPPMEADVEFTYH
jgi:high-affinity Fe2+/Pb2+ permease